MTLRSSRRWGLYFLGLALAILVLPPLWSEFAAQRPTPIALPFPTDANARYRVYVADWGYHSAIIIEQPPGAHLGPAGEEDAPWVEFAWGDRRFYMESNYWPHSLFATLFLPTASVTYVDGRATPPTGGYRALFMREISAAQLRALTSEVEASIQHNAQRERERPYAGVAGYAGRFYPAIDTYLWWNDCNRWTVDRLAAAGLAKSGRGVVFSGSIADRLIGFAPVTGS